MTENYETSKELKDFGYKNKTTFNTVKPGKNFRGRILEPVVIKIWIITNLKNSK